MLGLKILIMTINQMKWEIKVDPKQLSSPCFNIDFGSFSINLLSIIHVPLFLHYVLIYKHGNKIVLGGSH